MKIVLGGIDRLTNDLINKETISLGLNPALNLLLCHYLPTPSLQLYAYPEVRSCKWGRYARALEYIVCHRTYTQSTPLPPLFSGDLRRETIALRSTIP